MEVVRRSEMLIPVIVYRHPVSEHRREVNLMPVMTGLLRHRFERQLSCAQGSLQLLVLDDHDDPLGPAAVRCHGVAM